jgi:hypothetical protein
MRATAIPSHHVWFCYSVSNFTSYEIPRYLTSNHVFCLRWKYSLEHPVPIFLQSPLFP